MAAPAAKPALKQRRVQVGLRSTCLGLYVIALVLTLISFGLSYGGLNGQNFQLALSSSEAPPLICVIVGLAWACLHFIFTIIKTARSNRSKHIRKIPFGMSQPLICALDTFALALVCVLAAVGFYGGAGGGYLGLTSIGLVGLSVIIHYSLIAASLFTPPFLTPTPAPAKPASTTSSIAYNPRLSRPGRRTLRRSSRPSTIDESEWESESTAPNSTIGTTSPRAGSVVFESALSEGRPPTYLSYEGSVLSEPGTVSTMGGRHQEKVPVYVEPMRPV